MRDGVPDRTGAIGKGGVNRITSDEMARHDDGDVLAGGELVRLDEGGPPLKGRQVGLVPGGDAPLLPVDLPPGLRGYAREKVAVRQVADRLAVKAGTLEMRPFPAAGARGWSRMLVADRAAVEEWRARAGTGGRAVLPDYLALPVSEKVWTVAQSGGIVLARLGPEDGFAAAPDVAQRLIRDALKRADPAPGALLRMGSERPLIEALFEAREIPVVEDEAAAARLGLEPPKRFAHGELALDLRRDPGAARTRLARRVLPWRWPALATLVAAGLWAAAQFLATQKLEDRIAQVRAGTLETVRESFVPEGPVLDIRAQVSRAMTEARAVSAQAGGRVSPVDLFRTAAQVMSEAGAQPEIVSYSAQDGLSAVVRVADFAAVEHLAARLREAGLEVSVVESRVQEADAGVRSEMKIALGQPAGGR